ncbi:hypothetical protein BDB01DRAFT_841879 [Pilobolus umbonatus]|nr:hypothetical protein BDB01DRAFT_841879 [Pilobolus umbonatus]
MILWCYYYLAYWQIGLSDTCVILLAALTKVITRLKSERQVKRMTEHEDICTVYRPDTESWVPVSSADLVPGDVIKLQPYQTLSVDAVLLQGDIVVDESSLTGTILTLILFPIFIHPLFIYFLGEPLPIRKFPLKVSRSSITTKEVFDPQSHRKINTLFAGTNVKQVSKSSIATALVLKTRTSTDKGQLIQRILYPQPVSFIFTEQLKLVFLVLLIWAIVLLSFGIWWLGGTGMTAWFYGTVCAAQLINPLLPAMLVVGQSVAAGRLKKIGIFCVDLSRILMAGKVQVFCFDKTGTLTKEGLEYYGVYPSLRGEFQGHRNEIFNRKSIYRLLHMGLASCHSITTVDGDYIGNPVDIVMFKATKASLCMTNNEEELIILNDGEEGLEVIHNFEFQHSRASMSTVVKDLTTSHYHVFCKGSFEKIESISSHIPSNFHQLTTEKAGEGCYVLGIAHRDLGILDEEQENKIKYDVSRDDIEKGLEFIGLILFKNILKEDTASAITQLKQGDIRPVMITGDNALTGTFIGRQSGLVPVNTAIILGDVVPAHDDQKEKIQWTDVDSGHTVNNIEPALLTGSELAITGKAFRLLIEEKKMSDYLFNTRIFARMTPVDKTVCVEMFMEKSITAMCGDGGNDCGALRAAHVGIAMSEAEASVVSPFSTSRRSVQACVDLIIQGRAALASSFASYKYLIMYGETMALSKFCTFYFTLSFSELNFIFIDAFITVFCSIAVTQAKAADKLSSHRPTSRILGPEVMLSVIGQIVINALFLMGGFIWLYSRDDFFRCNEWDSRATDIYKWWLLGDSFEADLLTFIVLYQFINAAMVFNYGYLYRAAWYRNYLLMVIFMTFIGLVSYWELADPNRFGCLMRLNCGNPDVLVSLGYSRPDFSIEEYNNSLGHNVLPKPFRYKLWMYSLFNMVAVHIWERFVILGPIRDWVRTRYPLDRYQVKI